eukprot:TRINITY_DN3898_c0_g1_i2.p1 TRINITY_DN3898_c0_g1~~TRINITY_DN3898_c0_g1_i2.p1  ORF type:complete len:120 (+),score=15.48 TRINITY_DN3898_c0_g1_i2:135-494(+)
MGSRLGNWPSRNPHNFSQLRPSDAAHPFKLTPATYHPTHNRTLPPPNQARIRWLIKGKARRSSNGSSFSYNVISTEATNILLRQFYQRAEEKLRPKRAAPDHPLPDHGCKQPRGSFSDG